MESSKAETEEQKKTQTQGDTDPTARPGQDSSPKFSGYSSPPQINAQGVSNSTGQNATDSVQNTNDEFNKDRSEGM